MCFSAKFQKAASASLALSISAFAMVVASGITNQAIAQTTIDCTNHIGLLMETDQRQPFCNLLEANSERRVVTVMKKPKCPPSGPSSMPLPELAGSKSKCNPSSMEGFADHRATLHILNSHGSYTAQPLWEGDESGRSTGVIEQLEAYDGKQTIQGIDLGANLTTEWSVVAEDEMQTSDDLQNALKQAFPQVEPALQRGGHAILVIVEDE
ncbi:MAG: hypothetical protein AAF141_12520 [Pseudomonadota bacterium]